MIVTDSAVPNQLLIDNRQTEIVLAHTTHKWPKTLGKHLQRNIEEKPMTAPNIF